MNSIYSINFRAMGCQIEVQLASDEDVTAILEAIPEQVELAEDKLSRFRPNSELMQFNAQAGQWVKVSDTLFTVISQAKQAARQSNGLYNPLVLPAMLATGYDRSFEQVEEAEYHKPEPVTDWHFIDLNSKTHEVRIPESSGIDLGGIGKGWMASELVKDLSKWGACLVNMGGDIAVEGAPDGLEGWPIDIEKPYTGEILYSLFLRDSSIATSGIDYRRWKGSDGSEYHHIIDPRTGTSSKTDLLSVTVIHPHAPTAEAYTKAVMLMGSQKGLDWLKKQWHGTGLVVRTDGTVLATSNFISYLQERTLS